MKIKFLCFTAHSAVDSGKWQRSAVIIVRLVVELVERHLSRHLAWLRGRQKLVISVVEDFGFALLTAVDFAAFGGGHDGTLGFREAKFHLNIGCEIRVSAGNLKRKSIEMFFFRRLFHFTYRHWPTCGLKNKFKKINKIKAWFKNINSSWSVTENKFSKIKNWENIRIVPWCRFES